MQKHAAELIERDLVELHLDARQMGVGGVHSWGAKPDPAFLLRPDRSYRVVFDIRPFGAPPGPTPGLAASASASFAGALSPPSARAHALALEALDAEAAARPDAGLRCAFPEELSLGAAGAAGAADALLLQANQSSAAQDWETDAADGEGGAGGAAAEGGGRAHRRGAGFGLGRARRGAAGDRPHGKSHKRARRRPQA